jgi:hypothetical protein
MLVDQMPDQVGNGPLGVRGTQLPLVRGDGVHAFGERRLRGQERLDQVVSRHLGSSVVRGVTGPRHGTLGRVNGA